MTKDRIFASRDPHGVRPLCLGKKGGSWFVVSETCALDLVFQAVKGLVKTIRDQISLQEPQFLDQIKHAGHIRALRQGWARLLHLDQRLSLSPGSRGLELNSDLQR